MVDCLVIFCMRVGREAMEMRGWLSYALCMGEDNLDESWRICTKLGYLLVQQHLQSPLLLLGFGTKRRVILGYSGWKFEGRESGTGR